MTENELKVCQQFHLPVFVTGPYAEDHKNQEYFIHSISTYFSNYYYHDNKYRHSGYLSEDDFVMRVDIRGMKTYYEMEELLTQELDKLFQRITGYQYNITLEQRQRCLFAVDSSYIEIQPEFASFLQEKTELIEKKKLYNSIAKLVYAGKSRSEINKIIKQCVDEAEGKISKQADISDIENEFEFLWKSYPNKKDKKEAKKAYIRARKKGATYEKIEAGLQAYNAEIKRCNTQLIHIKHGGAWFNGECWNNEYNAQPLSSAQQPAQKWGRLKGEPSFDIDKIADDTLHNDNYDV